MNWSSGHHHFAHSADDQRPKLTYEQLRWAMDVALESGVGVLSCGGSVAKATRFVRQILSGFQIAAVDIDVTVNILTITVRPDAQAYPLTVMRVAPVGHQDFVRINLLEDFVNRFSADPERLPQASQRITEILASPPSWHRVKEAFALGAIAAAATLMLGGTF